MTNTKMTNRKALTYIRENFELPAEIADKVDSMILQLDKRASAERKPTKTQVENEGYKALILASLPPEPVTVTDIMKAIPEFEGFSNQKVTRLVTDLVDDKKMTRTVIKGRSYFTRA